MILFEIVASLGSCVSCLDQPLPVDVLMRLGEVDCQLYPSKGKIFKTYTEVLVFAKEYRYDDRG